MRSDFQQLVNAISEVMKYIHQQSYRKFQETNLYPGQHKFMALIKNYEGLTQKELAEKHFVKASTVTGMLSKLEANQFVYRVPDEDDKRIMRVYLTPKGKQLAECGEKFILELSIKMFEGFTDDEMAEYLSLTKKIRDNLQKDDMNSELH